MVRKYLLAVLMLSVNTVLGVPPQILDWSSNGSGASDPHDIMYLVNQGETITFTVSVDQPVNYRWQVNKIVDTLATDSSYTWTVPVDKGIWEIHVKVYNANGEDHMEWVVSTLDSTEAPTFFDYFTDLKSQNRTELDPWGRPLPEWLGTYAPPCTLGFACTFTYSNVVSTTTYGTWRFKYKFPPGSHGQIADFDYIKTADGEVFADYSRVWDAHHHCCVQGFSIDYDGAGIYSDTNWHTVTIIHTRDGWFYYYEDGCFDLWVHDEKEVTCQYMFLRLMSDPVYFDCIEVYEDRYLFPENVISYGKYIANYYCQNYRYYPIYREGIIVKGRCVTLADIDSAIGDPTKFEYDAATHTATCYTNLVVYEGSELIIEGETLKFCSTPIDTLQFVLCYGARLFVNNSVITSCGEQFWVWNNAGSTTHYGNERLLKDPYANGSVYNTMPLGHSCYCAVIIKNSVINNCAHVFFDSPYHVDIENVRFTNLHEVDIGNYTHIGSYSTALKEQRMFAKGKKSFWIYTDDINLDKFVIKDVVFHGAEPINVTFSVNAHRDKLNIYNVDVQNGAIRVKESLAQTYGQSHTCYCNGAPYDWKSYIDCEIGLVNCRFDSLIIAPGVFTDCEGRPVKKCALVKYYMDVLVVDSVGNPIPGATVTVKNEVDANYPAENMEIVKQLATGAYKCFYHHYRVLEGQPLYETITGMDGHTPLPSDSLNTIVVTDYAVHWDALPDEGKFIHHVDGIRVTWDLRSYYWRLVQLEVFDNVYGPILYKDTSISAYEINVGDTLHTWVNYDATENTVRMVITNQQADTLWDTGELKIMTAVGGFNFNQIRFAVREWDPWHVTKEIEWYPDGYVKLYDKIYRGEVEVEVDNMKLFVPHMGYIEDNNYSTDPGLVPVVEDGEEYYNLDAGTDGGSFTWEFDNVIDTMRGDGPWFSIWLRDSTEYELTNPYVISYTYTVKATYNGVSDSVVGVNPNPNWYREDPNEYPGTPESGTIIIALPIEVTTVGATPMEYKLDQNRPNPFNKVTTITYTISQRVRVELIIYNLLGEKVKTLVNAVQGPGRYVVEWDGCDDNGRKVAPGIYFYQIKLGDRRSTRKLLFVQ